MNRMKIANEVGNVRLMQRINRLKVLEIIRAKGPLARPEIAKMTGLSPSSITNIITCLLERSLVAEMGTVESRDVGRKATLIRFNPSEHSIVAVNVEIDKANIALTDLSGHILAMRALPIDRHLPELDVLDLIRKEIILLLEDKSIRRDKVIGIGLAVSGLVQDEGRFVFSSSLRWKGLSIREQFENLFQMPVFIQNNSRTKALWALSKYVEDSDRNVVFLDLAMGVGIVSFFEHRINEAVIGELGHTTVKKDGPPCFCGNRGCLELMCSVDAILNNCQEGLSQGRCGILAGLMETGDGTLTFETVLQAFAGGDADVRAVLQECGEYLGMGIANIINLFNPQRIIINGDLLLQSDFIEQTAKAEAGRRANEELTRGLTYRKVVICIEESIQGVALNVAGRMFELSDSIL